MANVIKPKRSSTSSSVPTTSDLADGEIAVNTADQKIYMRSGSNIITVADTAAASSGISNVVEDTTPQLGGNLDLNSNNITGTGNISTTGNFTLTSTDAGSAAAPEVDLVRNSSSPADADYLGQIKFTGENDAGQSVLYAKITGKISDASDTTEDGLIEYAVKKAGSNTIVARLTGSALKLINSTGLEVAGNITVDGTVDGRDVATDGTKLDTIATNADVTPSWVPSSDPSYITGLTLDNLTGKDAGTGDYTTNGDLVSGRGSGGVALTINDGYGNANVTFNHRNGIPEQNGQSARIEVNTDATSNEATMYFEFSASDVTANTAVGLTTGMTLAHDYVEIPNRIRHAGDNDTYIQFDADRIRLYAGNTAKIDTNVSYAPLASPTFTGTPAAPTASTGTNTTQLATTAFVQQEITALKALLYAYDQS